MSALEALRADVERVIAEHNFDSDPDAHRPDPVFCGGCDWTGGWGDHDAHVSERVMAMLADRWGLREEAEQGEECWGYWGTRVNVSGRGARLVTKWIDDTAREGGEG